MKVDAIIQARFGSTRLPGKVLFKILDKTILEYVIERVKMAKCVRKIIVATSTKNKDLEVANLARRTGVFIYRGSEGDVLDRFYQAAVTHNSTHIVRITGDCPLIDPKIIDEVVAYYFESSADYCSNTLERTYPDGEDVEVFGFGVLKKAWENASFLSEREHVTPYVIKHSNDFKIVSYKGEFDYSNKRWSLDRKNDFVFIKHIIEALYPTNPGFHMEDVLRFLELHPQLEEINKDHIINEGYQKSLREDRIFSKEKE